MAHNFFAFISYRHTDIKAAKRLQFLLESYNLPTMIQKMKPEAPKRFKVFRDADELTSGVLSDELHHTSARRDAKERLYLLSLTVFLIPKIGNVFMLN